MLSSSSCRAAGAAAWAARKSNEPYLASDSEEDESESEEEPEDAKAAKKAYLAKLLGGSGAIDEDAEGDGADERDDFFMSDDDGEDTAKASTMAFKKKRDKERYGSKAGDGDMEVTFHAGLEEFGARIKNPYLIVERNSPWRQALLAMAPAKHYKASFGSNETVRRWRFDRQLARGQRKKGGRS